MKTLLKDNKQIHDDFGHIVINYKSQNYITEIANLVYDNKLNPDNLKVILNKFGIRKIEDIKNDLLDLLLIYIKLIVEDHIITDEEKYNISILKMYFKIKEGDFYKNKFYEIEQILESQFKRLYEDNFISDDEALHKFELQDIFDLSYDQFHEFKAKEISRALDEGAKLTDLL